MCAGCGSTPHDSSVCPEGHGQEKKFIGTSQPGGPAVACHCQKEWRSAGHKPFMASKAGGEMRK